LTDLTDEVAVRRAAEGDQEAFAVLYERYVTRIYNYIYYRTGSAHDAEDLTARVFFRAMSNMKNYRDRGAPFSAWLYRIAHNLVANWYRDNSRRKRWHWRITFNCRSAQRIRKQPWSGTRKWRDCCT